MKARYWLTEVVSLVRGALHSGMCPARASHPPQKATFADRRRSAGHALSLLKPWELYLHLRRRITPGASACLARLLSTLGLRGGNAVWAMRADARPSLPAWTTPTAISDVFAVCEVPVPQCSLDRGSLPGTPPCNDPAHALRDDGVDALIRLMESKGTDFYKTGLHCDGILGEDDVVVIKINNQWGGRGMRDGAGRLATNTDVLKGLIWRILQHPAGFSGEIIVAENTQPSSSRGWNTVPANAEDPTQSIQDVVDAYQSLGYSVSLYNWTGLNDNLVNGGSIEAPGYPEGEYIHGNTRDGYILLDDPAGMGTGELSYPKFGTANGNYVSMRYGVWDGSSYDADRLTFINLPVLKRHGMAGASIAWKNLIGFVTCAAASQRYGGYNEMHEFLFGHRVMTSHDYGLVGRQVALIRAPDLHLVDAIWVAYQSNYYGSAIRQDVLLASTDPFAVDWYASEHVLLPLTGVQDSSAARTGIFRRATRINQKAAELAWPSDSGSYPYIQLLDGYDGDTPLENEKGQMNVYIANASAGCLTLVSPNGSQAWKEGIRDAIEGT